MPTQAIVRILILSWLIVAAAPLAATQRQPTRLLVDNATKTIVELSQLVDDKWQFQGRIAPGSSFPVYNVTNGDRFRAVWRGGSVEHVVKLRYDRNYGGWQDSWTVE